MSREAVRQAFAEAARAAFAGDSSKVYASRITDNRGDTEYISVYLEEGDVSQSFSGEQIEADLVVKYVKQSATDAQLDAVADAIRTEVRTNAQVADAVNRPIWTRFEYDMDASNPAINLIYRVMF